MSLSTYDTLLSIDEWANIFGIAGEFMNGFDRDGRQLGTQCDSVWFQYPWADTGDRLSRDEVGYAIYQAEQMLASELRYAPAPLWTENEWLSYSREYITSHLALNGLNPWAQYKSVKTRLGKVIAGGQRATTLISAGTAIVYSKSDGNGSAYQDRATITVATTVTDPCEIQVFFTTGDGSIFAAHPQYQIRPLRVTLSGGTATIIGDRSLFVSPEYHEFQNAYFTAADTGPGTNFVSTVDIYRVYNDTGGANQQQGVLVWEAEPQDCPDPPCQVATQTLCLGLRDMELGIVQPYPSTWDATTLAYTATSFAEGREPDRVRLNYYSGVPREVGSRGCRVNRRYAMMIARLAATLLPKSHCGCDQAERQLEYWAKPPEMRSDKQDFELASTQLIDNPFGMGRGAIFAWREVVRLRNGDIVFA